MACEEVFLKQLREHGLRLTPQREMVLSVMHRIEGLATAEDIYEQVHEMSSSVDISTVYRTLDLLKEFHLVASLDLDDGQRRYELLGIHGNHFHLICGNCGKTIGVEPAEAEAFVKRLREKFGFEIDMDRFSLVGLCRECVTGNGHGDDGHDDSGHVHQH